MCVGSDYDCKQRCWPRQSDEWCTEKCKDWILVVTWGKALDIYVGGGVDINWSTRTYVHMYVSF